MTECLGVKGKEGWGVIPTLLACTSEWGLASFTEMRGCWRRMGWRWRDYKFNFEQVKLDVPLRHLIKMSRKQLDTEVWISGERARRTVAIFHQVNPNRGTSRWG